MALAAKLFKFSSRMRPELVAEKLKDQRIQLEDPRVEEPLFEEVRNLQYRSGTLSAIVLKDKFMAYRRRDELVKTVRTIEVPVVMKLEGFEDQLMLVMAKKRLANEIASDLSRVLFGGPGGIVEARLDHEKFRSYFETKMEDARVVYFDQVDIPNVDVLALYGESLRDSGLYHEYLKHGKIWYVVVALPSRNGLTVGVTRNCVVTAFGKATQEELVDYVFEELPALLERAAG